MEISMIEFNIESKKETWRTPLLNHFRIVYLNFLVQLGGDITFNRSSNNSDRVTETTFQMTFKSN